MTPKTAVTLLLVGLVVVAGTAMPVAAHAADGPNDDNRGNDNNKGNDNRAHGLMDPAFAHWADGPYDDNKGNDNRAHGD